MTTRVVGDVAVRVGADVGPLKIGLQDGGRQVDRFGRRVGQAGGGALVLAKRLAGVVTVATAMGGAMLAASRKAISSLDSIGKKAAQIGTTAESLQKLSFAAESAGVSQSMLNSSMERFVKRLGEADQGFGAAKKQLEFLNLEARDLISLPLEEAVALVGDRMFRLENAAERSAAAAGLFGREGVAMVNMLRDGGKAFLETTKAAEEFGAVVSNEVVAEAEALQDQLGRLGDGIRGQLSGALVEAGPLLVSMAEFMLKLARAFNGFVDIVGDAFNAVDSFLTPLNDLEVGTNEVVAAMRDEIIQSQKLEAAMEVGGRMSAEMARQKLKEAQTRYENARAAIAEQRAIARGSAALKDVNAQLKVAQEARDSIGTPGAEASDIAATRRDAFEDAEARMVDLLKQRDELLAIPQELEEQMGRAKGNIEELQEALSSVVNGVVGFGGASAIEPIDPKEGDGKQGGSGGGKGPEGKDASFIDKLLGLDEESQERTAERMEATLAGQQSFMDRAREALLAAREQGVIDQDQYHQISERLEQEHNARMKQIRLQQVTQALDATSGMFGSLAQVAGKGGARLLQISKVFGAAKAFVDTMSGAAEALKLPFPMNLAAAASVISAGAGFIAAIRGTNVGSNAVPGVGVGATGGGSTASFRRRRRREREQQVTRTVDVNLRGGAPGQAQGIRDIIMGINEALDDGAHLRVNVSGAMNT